MAKGVVIELNRVREENSLAIAQLNKAHAFEKSQFVFKYESALIDKRDVCYNEALADSTHEVSKLKDVIYQGGYKLGLTRANIPPDHELFGWPALCPHNLYTAKVSFDSKE